MKKKILLIAILFDMSLKAEGNELAINPTASEPIFNEIFAILTPQAMPNYTKLRLGKEHDGGYIVPKELLSKVSRCYTYGAGDDISFETDLAKIRNNFRIRIHDHTVDFPNKIEPTISFKKEGLAPEKSEDKNTLAAHLAENGDSLKKIILKIDIEGAEWPALEQISENYLKEHVVIFIIEFHWFRDLEKAGYYLTTLKKLDKLFKIFHAHPNNCGGFFEINGKLFPNVIEITYINKKYLRNTKPSKELLPTHIDMENCPTKPNPNISYWLN